MKKYFHQFVSLSLAAVLAGSAVLSAGAAKLTYGDINGDGTINSVDALAVLNHSVGKITYTDDAFLCADVTGDGKVDANDALMILNYSISKLEKFPADQDTEDPTAYTKEQIVDYYNTALQSTYQQKVTMTKTEKVDIVVDSFTPKSLTSLVNNLIKSNAGTTTKTMAFSDGKASDGTLAADFGPKTGLTADGVKSATVTKNGSNYVVTINVVSEKATLTTQPKYNSLCAEPLDMSAVKVDGVEITKADFTYSATVLTATINSEGLVVSSSVYMPLSCVGSGKAFSSKIEAKLHGSWSQKVSYKY